MTEEELRLLAQARLRLQAASRARMSANPPQVEALNSMFGPPPTPQMMLDALPAYSVTPGQLNPNPGLPTDFGQYSRNADQTHFLAGDPRDPTPAPVFDNRLNSGQANSFFQGAGLNFADEFAGLIGGVGGAIDPNRTFSEGYDAARENFNADLAYAQQNDPGGAMFANLMGAVTTPAALAKTGISFLRGARPTAASIIARSGAEGAAYGAVGGAGAGDTMEERLTGAGIGAGTGGAVGAAAGALLGPSAARGVDSRTPNSATYTANANAAYGAGQAARVYLNPNIAQSIEQTLIATAQGARMTQDLSPMVFGYVRRLAREPRMGSSLDDIETFRQELRDIASTGNPNDQRIATQMIRELDQQIETLPDSAFVSLTGSSPTEARAAFLEGRQQWGMRARALAMERARFVASNAPNSSVDGAARQRAIQGEFRKIANDPDFAKLWSPEEQQVILSVVRGTNTANVLTQVANFLSPLRLTPANLGSVVGAAGAGFHLAQGPAGLAAATVPAIVGGAARGASRAVSGTNAHMAELLIRNGMQPLSPTLDSTQAAILAAMLNGGNSQIPWGQ